MSQNYQIYKIRESNRQAFQDFVYETSDRGFALAMRLLSDVDSAKDILQDSYIKIWEKRLHLSDVEDLYPLLAKIISNKCYDTLRKRKFRGIEYDSSEGDGVLNQFVAEDLSAQMDLKEYISVLQHFTSVLSTKQKIVFVLSELEGFSHKQIHEITGTSVNAVKSNLLLARKKIKGLINNHYAEITDDRKLEL